MISLELIKNISLFLSNEERHKISFLVIMNILLLHQLQYILIINILNLNIKMKNYLHKQNGVLKIAILKC